MDEQRSAIIESLKDSYKAYFDIEKPMPNDVTMCAVAAYHSRSEKYALVKRAKLWAVETHEYAYIYSVDELTPSEWNRIKAQTLEDGLARVVPHKEHMYTFITAVIVCDSMDASLRREIKRLNYQKSYKLSFYGYSMLRAGVLETGKGTVVTSPNCRDLEKLLRKQINKEMLK